MTLKYCTYSICTVQCTWIIKKVDLTSNHPVVSSNGFSSGYHTDQWFIQPGCVMGSNPSKRTNNVLIKYKISHTILQLVWLSAYPAYPIATVDATWYVWFLCTATVSGTETRHIPLHPLLMWYVWFLCTAIWHRNQTYIVASAPTERGWRFRLLQG